MPKDRASRRQTSRIAQRRIARASIAHYTEESVNMLHALAYYHRDELSPKEREFLKQATRNLARIHRAHSQP